MSEDRLPFPNEAPILRSRANRAFIRYMALKDGVAVVAMVFGLTRDEVRRVLDVRNESRE